MTLRDVVRDGTPAQLREYASQVDVQHASGFMYLVTRDADMVYELHRQGVKMTRDIVDHAMYLLTEQYMELVPHLSVIVALLDVARLQDIQIDVTRIETANHVGWIRRMYIQYVVCVLNGWGIRVNGWSTNPIEIAKPLMAEMKRQLPDYKSDETQWTRAHIDVKMTGTLESIQWMGLGHVIYP